MQGDQPAADASLADCRELARQRGDGGTLPALVFVEGAHALLIRGDRQAIPLLAQARESKPWPGPPRPPATMNMPPSCWVPHTGCGRSRASRSWDCAHSTTPTPRPTAWYAACWARGHTRPPSSKVPTARTSSSSLSTGPPPEHPGRHLSPGRRWPRILETNCCNPGPFYCNLSPEREKMIRSGPDPAGCRDRASHTTDPQTLSAGSIWGMTGNTTPESLAVTDATIEPASARASRSGNW